MYVGFGIANVNENEFDEDDNIVTEIVDPSHIQLVNSFHGVLASAKSLTILTDKYNRQGIVVSSPFKVWIL